MFTVDEGSEPTPSMREIFGWRAWLFYLAEKHQLKFFLVATLLIAILTGVSL